MIAATKLQEEYRRELNRVNSAYSKSISIIDGDGFLNKAIDVVIENFAVKFETNNIVRNHLRQLEVKNKQLDSTKLNSDIDKVIYPDDYYSLTRQWLKAKKEGCIGERDIDLHLIQSSDLNESLKDPYWKPSWEWEEALCDEAGDGLLIYHNCEFDVQCVYIDYLRKIKHIATPSLTPDCDYITSDGETITEDIDFEIDSTFIWRKVVDVAVLNTLLAKGDIQDYQAQLNNILTLDKIFLN